MTVSEIIESAAIEAGVNPKDPVFRAKLMKRLIASGYFRNINIAPQSAEQPQ